MIGDELALKPGIGVLEKMYIMIFGVPINGLRIRLRRILKVLPPKASSILDAGCGRGVFSYQLAKRFPEAVVQAVDIEESQLQINRQICEKVGITNLHFEIQDITTLAFVEEFDLVLSVDNIEHIEDDCLALLHLAKAMKPGGRLVLHVPARERRWFFYKFQTNFDVPGHFRPGYSMTEIKEKVRAAGFRISDAYYTYGLLENLSNNISYAITRAEAKNKILYALLFPFINMLSWLGRNSRPQKGAGILILADKQGSTQ